MKRLEFSVSDIIIGNCPAFLEATDKELRVLIALMETDGEAYDEELCDLCSVSEARLMSAIEFWLRAGAIKEKRVVAKGSFDNKLIEEFDERFDCEDIDDMALSETADIIKSKSLRSLYDELSTLMNGAELSHMDISRVASMIARYKIDEEYILNLAAHMVNKGKFSIHLLGIRVKELVKRDICTAEELKAYIALEEEERGAKYAEYRRVLGIYHRRLSESECKLLDKWSDEYCFGTEIVKKAYDFSVVATGNRSMPYIDTLLTDWHNCGCKTVDECIARHEAEKLRMTNEKTEKRESENTARRPKKNETPRFGNFDPEEVMKRALERTYASDDSNK